MQQSIVKFYCFVVQTLFNMFRALLCPSSGARQTAVAASGFRMNVEVFSAVVGLTTCVCKPEDANTVQSSWWWAMCRSKHVEPSVNFGIINSITSCTLLVFLLSALHVSGGTITHHQERKQLYLRHLVFVTPLLLSAAIVEMLELVWVCCGWRTPPTGHSNLVGYIFYCGRWQ